MIACGRSSWIVGLRQKPANHIPTGYAPEVDASPADRANRARQGYTLRRKLPTGADAREPSEPSCEASQKRNPMQNTRSGRAGTGDVFALAGATGFTRTLPKATSWSSKAAPRG